MRRTPFVSVLLISGLAAGTVGATETISQFVRCMNGLDGHKPIKTLADTVTKCVPKGCRFTLTMSPLSAQPACILKDEGCPKPLGCQLPRVILSCDQGRFIPSFSLCPSPDKVKAHPGRFPNAFKRVEIGRLIPWMETHPTPAKKADSPCLDATDPVPADGAKTRCLAMAEIRVSTCSKKPTKDCLVDADCGNDGGTCQEFQPRKKLDLAYWNNILDQGNCIECHDQVRNKDHVELRSLPGRPVDDRTGARSLLEKPIPEDGTESGSPYDDNSLKPYIICKGLKEAKDVDKATYRAECLPKICTGLDDLIKAQGATPDEKLAVMAALCKALRDKENKTGVKDNTAK